MKLEWYTYYDQLAICDWLLFATLIDHWRQQYFLIKCWQNQIFILNNFYSHNKVLWSNNYWYWCVQLYSATDDNNQQCLSKIRRLIASTSRSTPKAVFFMEILNLNILGWKRLEHALQKATSGKQSLRRPQLLCCPFNLSLTPNWTTTMITTKKKNRT